MTSETPPLPQEPRYGDPLTFSRHATPGRYGASAPPVPSDSEPVWSPPRQVPHAVPPAPSVAPEVRRDTLPVTLVWLLPALVTLGVGFYGIGHRQAWQDERATWWAATLSWADFDRLMHHFDIVLLPYYVLIHFWIEAFGDAPGTLRIPSVLAMGAAGGVLALLGRRLFDDGRVGLIAGLLFAAVPNTTRYAQEARPYAFAVLAAVLSTLLLVRTLDNPRPRRWIGYGLTIPFMGLAHLVTLTLLAAHLLAVLQARPPAAEQDRRPHRVLTPWLTTVAVSLAPLVPVVLIGQTQSSQISWIKTTWASLQDFPAGLFHAQVAAYAVMGTGLVGALFTRSCVLDGYWKKSWNAMLLCWALLPPLLLFAVHTLVNLFLTRYLLFTLPAWALLASAGLCSLLRLAAGRTTGWLGGFQLAAGAVAIAALVFATLPDIRLVRANPLPGEPDWDASTAWMLSGSEPGDGMAFNGARGERLAVTYELRHVADHPKDTFLGKTAQQLGAFQSFNCKNPVACAAGVNRIWVFSTDPKGKLESQMPLAESKVLWKHFRVAGTKQFKNVKVALLVRNGR